MSRRSRVPGVLLLMMIAGIAQAQENVNWPQFRGVGAAGTASGPAAPESWDVAAGTNIRWKTAIPGLAHASPVIWGDKIYLATADTPGAKQSLKTGLYGDVQPVNENTPVEFRVLCLDKSSGKILWDKTAYVGVPKVKRHPKATHANCTPAVDAERVVAFFGSEGLYCYDHNGNVLWKKDFGTLDSGYFSMPKPQWGFASSPVIYQDKVIVQCDIQQGSFVAALDAKTGNEIWRTPREEVPTWSTPAVVELNGAAQVICNGWKQIAGYNLADGKIIWWMKGGGDIPVPTPIFAHGLVFITNAHGGASPVFAIDLANANGDLSLPSGRSVGPGIAWSTMRGGTYMQTPIIVGDYLFGCLDNGQLSCWNATTGQKQFGERVSEDRKGFTASPVESGGRLYFPAEDGVVHVIAATPQFKRISANALGEECMASPAISDGVLYFRTRNQLIAVGAK